MADSSTEETEEEEMTGLDQTEEDSEAEDTLNAEEGVTLLLESAETSSIQENAGTETTAGSSTSRVDQAAVAKDTVAAEAATEREVDSRSPSQPTNRVLRFPQVNQYQFWSTTSE